ncbi:hypothetical protein CREGCYN_16410 [Synechococcus sp. M16CYN]
MKKVTIACLSYTLLAMPTTILFNMLILSNSMNQTLNHIRLVTVMGLANNGITLIVDLIINQEIMGKKLASALREN